MIGFDISIEMLRRFPRSPLRYAVVADVRRLPMPSESAQGAISLFGSLSYVLDFDNALAELSRVLTSGSPFVVMLLSRYSFGRIFGFDVSEFGTYGSQGAPGPGVSARFHSTSSARLFEPHGLRVSRVLGVSPWRANGPLRGVLWRVGTALGRRFPDVCHSLVVVGSKI